MHQVPMLPVVVPVAAVTMALLLWRLSRRDRLTAPRAAVAVVLCVYVAGVVANTVFPIYVNAPARDGQWTVYLFPLTDYDIRDAVTNIVVFAPVGVLVPLLTARTSWWRVIGVAAAFSAGIELTQLVTGNLLGGGHVADVHDLFFNVVGAALGFAVLRLAARLPVVARAVDRFRWR